MKKQILIFISAFLMMAIIPAQAATMVMELGVAEQVEPERSITISVEGNSVQVNGAQGMTLEVVSLTGRLVASYKIETPAQRVDLNISKGCYILKVGKVVRKVSVK